MMSDDGLSSLHSSSIRGFTEDPTTNLNPNPNTNSAKRKRNMPGTPDPDAEVIALSPKSLLATNRFLCEVCKKGFQRDQNLQLHRRGHNLPWKLRQRTSKEVKKRVYVCPEPSCVHNHPSRALGDLTGIKKHFSRKHGEKKFTCERCSKKYAVQSDWKAHVKTCGTREYRCECGTLFSRRDSFITHRAFCDALANETVRSSQTMSGMINYSDECLKFKENTKSSSNLSPPPPPPPLTPSTGVVSPDLSVQSSEVPENQQVPLPLCSTNTTITTTTTTTTTATTATTAIATASGSSSNSGEIFPSIFTSSTSASVSHSTQPSPYSDLLHIMASSDQPPLMDPMTLSLYPATPRYTSTNQPILSATALLQKAAQMGSKSSTSSFLHGFGLAVSTSSDNNNNNATPLQWNSNVELENNSMASGLGLGLHNTDFMMSPSTIFANTPTTLDLLGLGIGGNEGSSNGFSEFLTSMGGDQFGIGGTGDDWDELSDTKPSML